MELKDLATFVVSALALIVSAIAFWVSYRRGIAEGQRSMRQQLTATTDKITETSIESQRLMLGEAKDNYDLRVSLEGIFNQRVASLLRQAIYLADQIPALVTSVDCNTIAVFAADRGDLALADSYYQRAIRTSSNEFARAGNTRSYGQFLFTQRRFEEGRKAFEEAATLIKGGDNMARMVKGGIYQTWGQCERNLAAEPRRAEEAFATAKSQYRGVDNDILRENLLSGLAHAEGSATRSAEQSQLLPQLQQGRQGPLVTAS